MRQINYTDQTQRCSKCGTWKPFSEYYDQPTVSYGIMSRCKECHRAVTKSRYDRLREELERRDAEDAEATLLALWDAEVEQRYGAPDEDLNIEGLTGP